MNRKNTNFVLAINEILLMRVCILLLSCLFIFSPIFSQEQSINYSKDSDTYYLQRVNAGLTVSDIVTTQSTFTVYFLVPIAYKDQVPVWFEIYCPQMVDYKFIKMTQHNSIVAATINNVPGEKYIFWKSWVLTRKPDYASIPENVSIPDPTELPDSVKQWLKLSSCVQWNDPFIQQIADSLRDTTNNLNLLAERINDYCYNIPWEMPHEPYSFDAYYAMRWGNSCTGRAHAGAAIFRRNNIPCRILMNVPISNHVDQHWIIEYYVPSYGWVKMETSYGYNPNSIAHEEMITSICSIEDEFSILYPDNIEAYWFCSDTVFAHSSPNWGMAHSALAVCNSADSTYKIDQIFDIADSVYKYYTLFQGIELTPQQEEDYVTAQVFHNAAYRNTISKKTDSIIYNLSNALLYYKMIIKPEITNYYEDFESGFNGWTHNGIHDKWDVGIPLIGPDEAYSGVNCIGTDLDSVYNNNSNNWIQSPIISLSNMSCAFLDFRLWNDVEDSPQGFNPIDKFWVELSSDSGQNFHSISTCFGGVNDDPEVPSFGGWSHVVLDLSPYIDSNISIRFHFTSNDSIVKIGSFIDDVRIYGYEEGTSEIKENLHTYSIMSAKCYPVPSNDMVDIEFEIMNSMYVSINVINSMGAEVKSMNLGKIKAGFHKLNYDILSLPAGVYFINVLSDGDKIAMKMIKI